MLRKAISFFVLLLVLAVLTPNIVILKTSQPYIYNSPDNITAMPVAIVLGASVYPSGKMSDMLFDRAQAGLNLYKTQKVTKILVSGDHGTKYYDEVAAVKKYLLANGVVEKDIFLDHAGFDTYDSMYRARNIFDLTSAVIVSQGFHLSRAVYIARELGIDAIGLSADSHVYRGIIYNHIREIFSRVKAFGDVVLKAEPKFLGPKIPIQ